MRKERFQFTQVLHSYNYMLLYGRGYIEMLKKCSLFNLKNSKNYNCSLFKQLYTIRVSNNIYLTFHSGKTIAYFLQWVKLSAE